MMGMDAASLLIAVASMLLPIAEILIPVLMLAAARPKREGFRRRAVLILAAVALITLATTPCGYLFILSADNPAAMNRVYSLLSSIVVLVCLPVVVMTLFDASIWQALFCASAGYTIQNLASGSTEAAFLLLHQLFGIDAHFSLETGPFLPHPFSTFEATLIPLLLVYSVAFAFFVGPVRRNGLSDMEDKGMVLVLALVALVVISFDVLIKSLDGTAGFVTLLALRALHGTVCGFVLFVQFEMLSRRSLEVELAENQRIAAERERQYELSRANIEAINVKCHDIRHQIHAAAAGGQTMDPGFLKDMEREVAIYDSQVKTGNEALDTVLTEKGLICEREGITLTTIADGKALSALRPSEVYSFFGNALDNAIEAVREIADPDLRTISLTVRRIGDLASIHIENYFAGTRSLVDGMPETTKEDTENHGFGTRSMQGIVSRHGGTLTYGSRGQAFIVDAMIPAADDAEARAGSQSDRLPAAGACAAHPSDEDVSATDPKGKARYAPSLLSSFL